MNPATAIILLNYNSLGDTIECLKSLSDSAVPPSIVLVDNGSVAEGRANPEKLEKLYPDIHVIMSDVNLGFGGGNNLGIRWALKNSQAEFIYILNNDTVSDVNSIKILEEYLEKNPSIDACSPRIMLLDEPDRFWYGGGHINWARAGARSWFINQSFDGDLGEKDITFITGCAMFARREMLEAIGGFDERFFMYCEDVDLSVRIVESGFKMKYIPSSVVYHKAHSSIRSKGSDFFLPEEIGNPRLCFYLENLIYGTLLNLSLHARGIEKLQGMMWLLVRWSRLAFCYIRRGRTDALKAMIDGFFRYRAELNKLN